MFQDTIVTKRLVLEPLQLKHHPFLLELLNTEGWLKFIGDRNVHSLQEAETYVQNILNNPDVHYWAVMHTKNFLGVVTLIKRTYLTNLDIGFAFLPQHSDNGYAAEAAAEVIKKYKEASGHSIVHAVTLPDNTSSIKLLSRLNFKFNKEIEPEKEKLHLYTLDSKSE